MTCRADGCDEFSSRLTGALQAENGRSPSCSPWGLAVTLCCVEDLRQCLCAATSARCPCFHAQKIISVVGQTQHPSSTQWAQQPTVLSWPLFFPPAPLPTRGPPPHGTHLQSSVNLFLDVTLSLNTSLAPGVLLSSIPFQGAPSFTQKTSPIRSSGPVRAQSSVLQLSLSALLTLMFVSGGVSWGPRSCEPLEKCPEAPPYSIHGGKELGRGENTPLT